MAEKKTWYFHGTELDDLWSSVGNWTANHVYNVADDNPTYPPWTNTSEFPDADLRKGSAYTGTDITLDVAIGASEWDGTYNSTTFIGVEKLDVNITLDYSLPASINGGIWTSTIYGNNECQIKGGIFFGNIIDGDNGIWVGSSRDYAYNPWLPVFYGTVTCSDDSVWESGIHLGDVVNNNTVQDCVLRGSVDVGTFNNCAIYKPSSLILYPWDEVNGSLTDTIFMRNTSSTTDTRQFGSAGVLLKGGVFMQPLTKTQLANAEIGDCYFHDTVDIPASCKVGGGLFKKAAIINGSIGVSVNNANDSGIFPPVFYSASLADYNVTVTSVSIASTAVFTATAHGLATGYVIDTPLNPASVIFPYYGRNTITKIDENSFSIPVSTLPAGTFTITFEGNTTSSLNIATSTNIQVRTALRLITGFSNCLVTTATSWTTHSSGSVTYLIDRVDFGVTTLPTLTKSLTVGALTLTQSRAGTVSQSAQFNLTRTLQGGSGFVASIVHQLEKAIFTQNFTDNSTSASESTSSIFAVISAKGGGSFTMGNLNGSDRYGTSISGTAAVIGGVTLFGSITGGYFSGSGITCSGAISGGLFAVNSLTTSGAISGSTAKFMGSVLTNSGTVTGGVIFSTGIVNTGTLSNGCTVYGTFTTKGTQSAKMPIDQIGIE